MSPISLENSNRCYAQSFLEKAENCLEVSDEGGFVESAVKGGVGLLSYPILAAAFLVSGAVLSVFALITSPLAFTSLGRESSLPSFYERKRDPLYSKKSLGRYLFKKN